MESTKEGVFYERPTQRNELLQEKKPPHKKLGAAVKMVLAVIGLVALSYIIHGAFLIGIFALSESGPADKLSGIEDYDKKMILDTYGGDLDSGLFVFPDNTEGMINPSYISSMKTGLFDTDGYMILQTKYNEEEYQEEVERLSRIECTVSSKEDSVTQKVKYDESSYALPAYVASDGFDSVYEYALMNEDTYEISYIFLSYPNYMELIRYKQYLKVNPMEYEIEDALNQFTIYAHTFNGGDYWVEYSDMGTEE